MEEILQELIKTTLEKGPQNKQFYSNLSITKPIHDHADAVSRLTNAISYLQSSFKSGGFQSKLYTSRNCAIECDSVYDNFSSQSQEILTSVLALDLLFNNYNEHLLSPCFEQIVTLPNEIQDALQDFIVPSMGLTTFNLFKQPWPPSEGDEHQEDFDSGNDSPVSMYSKSEVTFTTENFPDDINTTSLTISVLLHQGVLQPKPAESVVRWMISNAFIFKEECNERVPEDEWTDKEQQEIALVTFPSFITKQGTSDPVSVINFLSLMYSLDISHEVILKNGEELLITTLKNTLASLDTPSSSDASTKTSHDSLGNTSGLVSSDKKAEQQGQAFILHHSPDSMLYFLSRSLAIASKRNNSRTAHNQITSFLLELLEVRLGTTMDTCDLAMRILAGVYLSEVNNPGGKHVCSSSSSGSNVNKNTQFLHARLSNSLQREFETLVSLQNVDGSWPPDSILKIGFSNNANGHFDEHQDDDKEEINVGSEGYLGGKQLSTLFAVKAVSLFSSVKRGNFVMDEEEDDSHSDSDSEIHHLY